MRASSERRPSPKKEKKRERVAKTVSSLPPMEETVPLTVHRKPIVQLEPLPVDVQLRNHFKAANYAFAATNFVMAVCFIVVPFSCYRNLMLYLPLLSDPPAGPEPWEHYFDLV